MVRVTVRKRRTKWHVSRDGDKITTCPTKPQALRVARRTARDTPGRPPIELREPPGVWRTIIP